MFSSFMPDMVGIQLPPHEAIPLTAAAGFAGFDLRMNNFVDAVEAHGTDALRGLLENHGLRPGYASLVSGKVGVPEPEWESHLRDLPRRARLAHALGYRRSASVILPFSDTMPFAENFDLHVRRIREACAILSDFGIGFGVEYVSPLSRRIGQPNPFVFDLEGALELVAAADAPGAGLMIDSFHWACAEESAQDVAALNADQIIAVHVNDLVEGRPLAEQTVMERELPGTTGLARVEVFLAALAAAGYDGPITAEPTHPRWSQTDAREAAQKTGDSVNAAIAQARRVDLTKL